MQSPATTVELYLAELDTERQAALKQLRSVIKKRLPAGFKEQMQWGQISYVVPHALYPAGYHCNTKEPLPFLALASQKSHIALYHMGLYADARLLEWFTAEHAKASARKLDMGKSCIRYKKPTDIPHELIGELASRVTPQQWIKTYEASLKPQKA